LVVHSTKGIFSKQVEHPRGDPANPLSAEELKTKFFALAAMRMERDKAEAVVKAVLELKQSGFGELSSALKGLET
jgi:2-methylcitrate dehydratase PrpD